MENLKINLDKIKEYKNCKEKYGSLYYKKDDSFYKIIQMQKDKLPAGLLRLKEIENKFNLFENLGIRNIEEICFPTNKLYYQNIFVGYTSDYLYDYKDLFEGTKQHNKNEKIDFLIKLSIAIKKLHELGISHSDIHSGNVFIKNNQMKIIDFDDSSLISNDTLVTYYESPYADVAGINNLMLLLLTNDDINQLYNYNAGDLPKDIIKYIKYFNSDVDYLKKELITSSIPSEYPHDWLAELKKYEYINRVFQKKR